MAKIGCLKPFRGSYNALSNIVLEDGEIAFETTNKRIYMGNGTDSIGSLTPYINTGTTDISNIGDGSITGAINTINSNTYIISIGNISGTYDSNGIIMTDVIDFDSTTYRPVSAWCNYISWGEYPKRVYMEILTNITARIDLWGTAGQILHEANISFLCVKQSNIHIIYFT